MASNKQSTRVEKERLIEEANKIFEEGLSEAETFDKIASLSNDRRMVDYLLRHYYDYAPRPAG